MKNLSKSCDQMSNSPDKLHQQSSDRTLNLQVGRCTTRMQPLAENAYHVADKAQWTTENA